MIPYAFAKEQFASRYLRGDGLDQEQDEVENSRDRRACSQRQARACGQAAKFPSAPYRAALSPYTGGGQSRLQYYPMIVPAAKGPLTVSTGFGRYVPYTEVAAVTSGEWSFIPVFGGLRVALPTRKIAGKDSRRVAQTVASDPARYGFLLQGDTYVHASLGPGDRYLLSTTGQVF